MATTPLPLPMEVDDLTPEWFSAALGQTVGAVTVLDRHSGTTGRAHVALVGDGVPLTVFVKLPPFDAGQRVFVDSTSMGTTEARFYRDLAPEIPARIPAVWFSDYEAGTDGDGDHYVMVLEDLTASGCRFPTPTDDDIAHRARDIVEQLVPVHARFWTSPRFDAGGDLEWIAPKGTGRGDGGAAMVQMALDALADRLPEGFVPLAEFYVARSPEIMQLYRAGERTLIHGDAHLGNLFVDGDRTGFLDWAVLGYAPGMRDVAYTLTNSIPTEVRRASERDIIDRYCELLRAHDIDLVFAEAWEQYRLFSVYSWVAAACTAAMGSKWQPEHVGLGGTARATVAAVDLDALGLLHERL
ncbi:MAG: phosphotransferase [Actinomycetota bacterium]|nr:phosphotransferase [Actinomycetota bacterium]